MIFLFTDFSLSGPYVGQMKAVLARRAPGAGVIDLLHDAPAFNPRASAHLLAACVSQSAPGDVFLCVVDPGVGMVRRPVVLEADGRWFVGPDNGLLDVVAGRARSAQWWEITWRPSELSASFHGRDLFAPVAAGLASSTTPADWGRPIDGPTDAQGDDWAALVYVDGFGNAMTGLRAAGVAERATLQVAGRRLRYRRTFGEAAPGEVFWTANSLGLVELAANGASAAATLGLTIGDPVVIADG